MAGSQKVDPALWTMEEAVDYTEWKLDHGSESAKALVKTMDQNSDGLFSKSELQHLIDAINEIKQDLLPRFRNLDPTGSGFVDPKDAIAILSQKLKEVPHTSVKAMVTRFDKDNNNKVDFGEFIYFYACIAAKTGYLQKKFEELDADASGDLDADELVRTLMEDCALPEFQARSLVDDFDINKDSHIDRAEFTNMWMKLFG